MEAGGERLVSGTESSLREWSMLYRSLHSQNNKVLGTIIHIKIDKLAVE